MTNPNKSKAQQQAAKEARGKADVLSLRLFHVAKIAHLAAFAAEARRVLEETENVKQFQPKMAEAIFNGVSDSNDWKEMEDTSGDVLSNLARELEKINIEFTKTVYGAANVNVVGIGEEGKE